MEEKYLTVDEASEYLGLKKSTLYWKVHYNQISHIKRGRALLFTRPDLDKYLESITKKIETDYGKSR
jgi:excisionase family DNA binding protein